MHYKKSYVLQIILLVAFGSSIFINSVHATSPEQNFMYDTVSERLDLNKTGSLASPYIANLTENYDVIDLINIVLHFASNSFTIKNFAAGNALTNGVLIKYNNHNLLNNDTLRTNDDLQQYSDRYDFIQDSVNPKDNQIQSQYLFPSPHELIITSSVTVQFYVQDTINTTTYPSIYEFFVFIKGYKLVQSIIADKNAIQMVHELASDPRDFISQLVSAGLLLAPNIFFSSLSLLGIILIVRYAFD